MEAQTEVLGLRHRLREQRDELAQLRRRLHENDRHGRRVRRAHEDALQMAAFHISGLPTSIGYMLSHGLTRRRWENARALLMLAKVHNGDKWIQRETNIINGSLSYAATLATERPGEFKANLSRHASY